MRASTLVEDWKSFRLRTIGDSEDCELDRLELAFRINSTNSELYVATDMLDHGVPSTPDLLLWGHSYRSGS
jgi:hypothetical protein